MYYDLRIFNLVEYYGQYFNISIIVKCFKYFGKIKIIWSIYWDY